MTFVTVLTRGFLRCISYVRGIIGDTVQKHQSNGNKNAKTSKAVYFGDDYRFPSDYSDIFALKK